MSKAHWNTFHIALLQVYLLPLDEIGIEFFFSKFSLWILNWDCSGKKPTLTLWGWISFPDPRRGAESLSDDQEIYKSSTESQQQKWKPPVFSSRFSEGCESGTLHAALLGLASTREEFYRWGNWGSVNKPLAQGHAAGLVGVSIWTDARAAPKPTVLCCSLLPLEDC